MTPLVDALTEREEQVLLMLARGYGIREIAAELGVSQWTARHHRASARMKLEAANQTHAVAILMASRAVVT